MYLWTQCPAERHENHLEKDSIPKRHALEEIALTTTQPGFRVRINIKYTVALSSSRFPTVISYGEEYDWALWWGRVQFMTR